MQMPRIFALALLAAVPAQALDVKTPQPPAPAKLEPAPQARAAFEALPERDRVAVQEALGWLGLYNGVFDGAYGRRTVEAFAAWQQSVAKRGDGIVTPAAVAALGASTAKAKAAVGFRLIDDPATGLRIGAPTKLLEKRDSAANAASLKSGDGAVGLYLKATTGNLAALYKSLSADSGPRKVTYKFLKPDAFFVTTGEEGDNKFYRRYAVAPGGGDNAPLRGFAFLYPKARAATLDPIALAIANAFDPFPSTPLAVATPTPTPEPPKLTATALIVAPGIAVTALDPAVCKAPLIGGKPARFLEAQGGLTRLGGEFASVEPIPLGAGGGDLVALSLSPSGAHAVLDVVSVASLPGAGEAKVFAALGRAASGAPLFDRQGRLVAFVAPIATSPRRAGVTLAAPHATIPAASLGANSAGQGDLSAPDIARLRRAAVVGVFCAS